MNNCKSKNFSFVNHNTFFANSVDPYQPEAWAQESLAVLEDNIMAAGLVHRDFESTIASFGDTVNTRQPATFQAKRKTVDDDVEEQNASATNVAVVLNQLVHVTFLLRDAERSLAFKDLVTEFLDPAMKAQAKFLDQIVLGQLPQFLGNAVGGLGSLSSTNVRDRILAGRNKMNINKAPEEGRNLIWTPNSETEALKLDLFVSAQNVGDGGNALTTAALGRKFGFNNYMSQLAASVPTTAVTAATGAINAALGHAVGATSVTVDGFSAAIPAGSWVSIDGQPYRVVSTIGGVTPTAIVISSPGLRLAVADNAVVKTAQAGAINLAAGYANGYAKYLTFDGLTATPAVGQMVSFTASPTSAIYTITDVTSTTMQLDRPLEVALVDNDIVNPGPAGDYNFAFNRNAISLIVRPLALIPAGMGAQSAIINHNGLSMRATLSHDGVKQGIRVTLDMLCGVKVMNTSLGSPILG